MDGARLPRAFLLTTLDFNNHEARFRRKGRLFSRHSNYSVTEAGAKVTDEYHDIKAEILIERLKEIHNIEDRLEGVARFPSILTGVYEESARDSATFTPSAEE